MNDDEELIEVFNCKAKIGFNDKNGFRVIHCQYDWASLNGFEEGMCLVANRNDDEIWLGFIDKTGKTVVDCSQYDYTMDFKNGYAPVQKNGLWGLIDKTGKEMKPCELEDDNKLFDNVV